MLITIYRTGRRYEQPIWTCYGPGAQGCGTTPWGALADMLATWNRRGRPDAGPSESRPSGADWIITKIIPRTDAGRHAAWLEGENLNAPENGYGRRIFWGIDDVRKIDADPRFEILCR